MDFEWTEEAEYYLRMRWAEGLTTRAIADWFTTTYFQILTRNAIAGKVNRLGLPRRVPVGKLSRRLSPPKKLKPWVPQREHVKPPSGHEVSFMDLGWAMCRYIPGNPADANTMYCGAPVLGVYSYCSYHYKLCHKKQRSFSPSGALLGAVAGSSPPSAGGGSDFAPTLYLGLPFLRRTTQGSLK